MIHIYILFLCVLRHQMGEYEYLNHKGEIDNFKTSGIKKIYGRTT